MCNDFPNRSDAARLDDLVAANPKDRSFINCCAIENFCLLGAWRICDFLHIFVLFSPVEAIMPGTGQVATPNRIPSMFAPNAPCAYTRRLRTPEKGGTG